MRTEDNAQCAKQVTHWVLSTQYSTRNKSSTTTIVLQRQQQQLGLPRRTTSVVDILEVSVRLQLLADKTRTTQRTRASTDFGCLRPGLSAAQLCRHAALIKCRLPGANGIIYNLIVCSHGNSEKMKGLNCDIYCI